MAHRVGVRQLRDRLSAYLRRVKQGECVEITDRGQVIALITPAQGASDVDPGVLTMVREGVATWSGGKPQGARRPVKLAGRSLSQIALEDRR